MKIAAYCHGGDSKLGIVKDGYIVPMSSLLPDAPSDMKALIRGWGEFKGALEAAMSDRSSQGGADLKQGGVARTGTLDLASVTLLPPIVHPEKLLAIGLNYADHVAETGREKPEFQTWFAKHGNCIVGAGAGVEIPKVSSKIDYEVELVVIIGKRGRHISRAAAPAHVFGYCVGNDVSVRDWQRQTPQWVLGKSFDTHAPIGPWITTADEATDPHGRVIQCWVNGEVRQQSNTRELVFDVWAQIEHVSQALTLEPGDLIFTGTPGGVGAAMKPPRWLVAGDKVRCEIDGLGAIENVMIPEA